MSSTINLSAKYGAAPASAVALLKRAHAAGLRIRGLSFHVGSQCMSPQDFVRAIRLARDVWMKAAAAGFDLDVLDIGGGFPAPYRTPIDTLSDFCRVIRQELDATFGHIPARIIAEPGRALCAEAVTLVTKVIGRSVRNGVPWYFIDDGLYGSFSGKLFDHADFPLIAERTGRRPSRCVVAGPTCDSTDVVAEDQKLPRLEPGDFLLVPSMGAYTSVSASSFNGIDRARIVAIE